MGYVTDQQIKEAAVTCKTKAQCAAMLGIDYSTLWRRIHDNEEIMGLFPSKKDVEQRRVPGCRTRIDCDKLRKYANDGFTRKEAAHSLGVSYATVHRISKFYKIKFKRG